MLQREIVRNVLGHCWWWFRTSLSSGAWTTGGLMTAARRAAHHAARGRRRFFGRCLRATFSLSFVVPGLFVVIALAVETREESIFRQLETFFNYECGVSEIGEILFCNTVVL